MDTKQKTISVITMTMGTIIHSLKFSFRGILKGPFSLPFFSLSAEAYDSETEAYSLPSEAYDSETDAYSLPSEAYGLLTGAYMRCP